MIARKNSLNKSFLAAIALAVAITPMAQAAPKTIAIKPFVQLTKDVTAEGMFVTSKAIITYANIVGQSSDIQLRAIDMVGAAKLLDQSGDSPTTLREKVTSPNGTTFAALNSFNDSDISEVVSKAMKAAHDRSQELA